MRNYKSVRVLVHVLVWVLFFSIMVLPGMVNAPDEVVTYYTVHFLLLLSATYINIAFLIRQYFDKEKYKKYIFGLLAVWLVAVSGIYISSLMLLYPFYPDKFVKHTAGAMVAFSMEFFLFALYKAAKEWYIKSQRSKEMELAKVQAELSLLRSQLDSHFIFNTLNNLYLLVLKKSDKAPDAILMLSDMLSYTIYENHEQRVSLAKELDFIENYISLQQLRLDDSQVVYYEVAGDKNRIIEPLILFNFIENAFKHADGFVQVNGKDYYVYIHVDIKPGSIVLRTINGKADKLNDMDDKHSRNGVGLANTIKRLNLAYDKHYILDIDDAGDEYHVALTINEL